jgi:hypothetical protein
MIIEIETHPLEPFLPENARLLMLGSFPPPRNNSGKNGSSGWVSISIIIKNQYLLKNFINKLTYFLVNL